MSAFHTDDLKPQDRYRYVIGSIAPRPIAWVSTRDANGVGNLAPFSFFNAIMGNPPTLAFSVGDRDGEMKDTSRNVEAHPEFIVHLVGEALADKMNLTSGDFGAPVNEFTEAGLTPVPGNVVDVPRVSQALIALECRMTHHLRLGGDPARCSHIIGEVLYWHIDDRVHNPGEREPINMDAMAALGRMGGIAYTRTRDRLEIDRPVIAAEDPRSIASHKGE